MSVEIVIDGFAQAQQAPRGVIVPPLPKQLRGRYGVRMYSPIEVRKWQTTARVIAAETMKDQNPYKGALVVVISVYLAPPVSFSKKKLALALEGQIRPTTRPDLDNYCKAIADSLTGVVWLDDAQIVTLTVTKLYAEKPRVEVTVTELPYPMAPIETATGELFK